MEFIDKPEEKVEPFEQYFDEVIVPMVEEANRVKDRYRSKFWGYLFSVVFLMSANVLVVLFNTLMRKTPMSWEQLILINMVAFLIVFWPVYKYNRLPKNDIFDAFLRFYGDWRHVLNKEVKLVHSPIIPKHEMVKSSHDVLGEFGDVKVEMRDTFYTNKRMFRGIRCDKVVSSGVILYVTFPQKFDGSLLMFDRGGFYRKNKFPNYGYYNDKLSIPAANYFNIFCSNERVGELILHNMFFENILDLKDVFKARNLYLQAEDNYMRVYLEGSELYFDNYKLWSTKVDKNRFRQLHEEFDLTYSFVQIVKSLMEQK